MSKSLKPKVKELVVFMIRSPSSCHDCKCDLHPGSFLYKNGAQVFCLTCADMDHLEFLPSGDAAVTRRSRKYSYLSAVVVQWAHTRKRYERQGILVEASAIEKAEKECLSDQAYREIRRKKDEICREKMDQKYVMTFSENIRKLYPNAPKAIENQIAEHACEKYSGRVGRAAAAKELKAEMIHRAVQAHVRHCYTNYDDLLMQGFERFEARQTVRDKMQEILSKWEGEKEL